MRARERNIKLISPLMQEAGGWRRTSPFSGSDLELFDFLPIYAKYLGLYSAVKQSLIDTVTIAGYVVWRRSGRASD